MIQLKPEDFPDLDTEHLEELEDIARRMGRSIRRRREIREARKQGLDRPQARLIPQEEAPVYPPDPQWQTDERGRFWYQDYDGESLHISHEEDGGVWIDKKGEGPVYIRSEDIPVIIDAIADTRATVVASSTKS